MSWRDKESSAQVASKVVEHSGQSTQQGGRTITECSTDYLLSCSPLAWPGKHPMGEEWFSLTSVRHCATS